jgi:predicted dienelactone hydrolase
MYRFLSVIVMGLLGTFSVSVGAQEFHVGKVNRFIKPSGPRNWRGAKTQGLISDIWYPVNPKIPEQPQVIGPPGKPIFYGHPIAEHASLSNIETHYPLILISHGTGGSADSLDWLGAELAAHGFIAVGVNHPGNNALEPYTWQGFNLWWERTRDLSDVLDAMLKDEQFGSHIDEHRIGAAGFSLGGYTVLELAGARTNRAALIRFCNSAQADAVCTPPEMREIPGAQHEIDADSPEVKDSIAHSGDSYRDPRIRAVYAIAPALGEAFEREDLKDIHIPVRIVAGASDKTVPPDTNAKRFAGMQPTIHLEMLPGGVAHYTFIDSCLPTKEYAPPFCGDFPGVDRAKVHASVAADAISFFATQMRH